MFAWFNVSVGVLLFGAALASYFIDVRHQRHHAKSMERAIAIPQDILVSDKTAKEHEA